MAVAVDQDVSVMPILDLQEVRDDAVACKRFDKVALRSGKATRVHGAVGLQADSAPATRAPNAG